MHSPAGRARNACQADRLTVDAARINSKNARMEQLIRTAESQLARLSVPVAVRLPGGRTLGVMPAAVVLEFRRWSSLGLLVAGRIGAIAEGFVEDNIRIDGSMRDVMSAAAGLLRGHPVSSETGWWRNTIRRARSAAAHSLQRDAEQIRFHYDVSDDFYALWLDPRRVYSCAYFAQPHMTLAQAQEAKLDLICRKLQLRAGERFLDIGAGWGGLLLWAAEHYGVDATGITLSRNQQAHVQQLIMQRGLQDRVRIELRDYRDLPAERPFDKIASVGMFEHVGRANLGAYFGAIARLLAPGGLVLNHGITACAVDGSELGSGMGEFIEKYIFPGGELLHVSQLLRETALAGLEMVDTENLRPHCAQTLWAWSDALEANLDAAHKTLERPQDAGRAGRILRAYRLYLAGSAMSFERGWIALHQMLSTRPSPACARDGLPGAQSVYSFNRSYMYT
jgi:cyclopropane-fatty-acyl-phospholipid synthase